MSVVDKAKKEKDLVWLTKPKKVGSVSRDSLLFHNVRFDLHRPIFLMFILRQIAIFVKKMPLGGTMDAGGGPSMVETQFSS